MLIQIHPAGIDDKNANVRSEALRLCGEAAAQLWGQAQLQPADDGVALCGLLEKISERRVCLLHLALRNRVLHICLQESKLQHSDNCWTSHTGTIVGFQRL